MSVRTLNDTGSADAGRTIAPDAAPHEVTEFFDRIYREAERDEGRVPWHRGRPTSPMVTWLNASASGLVRPGSRVVVVGCGLGDDVAELCCRGYDAVGMDVSSAGVEWARARHPEVADRLLVGDVTEPSARMVHRFDLVVEACTIQSVPPSMRSRVVSGVASLARPHGHVLAICEGRADDEPLDEGAGPPYPLSAQELTTLFAAAGLHACAGVDDFEDDTGTRRLRGLFRH